MQSLWICWLAHHLQREELVRLSSINHVWLNLLTCWVCRDSLCLGSHYWQVGRQKDHGFVFHYECQNHRYASGYPLLYHHGASSVSLMNLMPRDEGCVRRDFYSFYDSLGNCSRKDQFHYYLYPCGVVYSYSKILLCLILPLQSSRLLWRWSAWGRQELSWHLSSASWRLESR